MTADHRDDDPRRRYPMLHRPERWEWAATTTMAFSTHLPDDAVVVSTHVVGFTGGDVLLCRGEGPDDWFLPGGTRERGETAEDSLVRELLEEAGARLTGPFHGVGAHAGVSEAPAPCRPHLAHPFAAWLWGWGEVEVVAPPSVPEDGERVTEVATFPLAAAQERLAATAAWGPELLALAADLRRS